MRKLASIQRVVSITPIENADRIEVAQVLGWKCVVKKGEYKVGDLVIYFEPDSFLPETEEYEFLRQSGFKDSPLLGRGFKLKTAKLRGQISQGLLMPTSILPENIEIVEGKDVTDELGVKKWEEPEVAGSLGTMIGGRPDFIPKTDETRVQSDPKLFEAFTGLEYYITTKMDGTSCSVGVDSGNEVHYTSHNNSLKDDGESGFIKVVKNKGIPERLLKYKAAHPDVMNITVQGELCGEKIQKNRLKLLTPQWFVFTVIINGERVGLHNMQKVVEYIGADMVPVEEIGTDLTSKYANIESLLLRAEGMYPKGGQKEGIVIRPVVPIIYEGTGEVLSMKVLNNKYLLKTEE